MPYQEVQNVAALKTKLTLVSLAFKLYHSLIFACQNDKLQKRRTNFILWLLFLQKGPGWRQFASDGSQPYFFGFRIAAPFAVSDFIAPKFFLPEFAFLFSLIPVNGLSSSFWQSTSCFRHFACWPVWSNVCAALSQMLV